MEQITRIYTSEAQRADGLLLAGRNSEKNLFLDRKIYCLAKILIFSRNFVLQVNPKGPEDTNMGVGFVSYYVRILESMPQRHWESSPGPPGSSPRCQTWRGLFKCLFWRRIILLLLSFLGGKAVTRAQRGELSVTIEQTNDHKLQSSDKL